MTTLPHLRAAVLAHPWAILPDRLEAIAEVLERRFAGVKLDKDEIAAIRGDRAINGAIELFSIDASGIPQALDAAAIEARGAGGGSQPAGVVAVINVSGVIAQHAHQVDNISGPGGTSVERLTNSFRMAMSNPDVVGIIFNHDSPGGNVHGVQALADEIFAARGKKPIVSQVNSTMASASYWIGASSDEIVMTPGSQAGSIGVYAMHKDVSGMSEKLGVKMSFISAGKYKVEGHPYEPLADDAAQAMQAVVDEYYGDFIGAVAKFRGVKVTDVRDGFGEGRMLKDKTAVKAGLADRVATMDDTIRRVATGKVKASSGAKAEGDLLIVASAPAEETEKVEDQIIPAEPSAEEQPITETVAADEKTVETEPSENDIAAAQAAADRDAYRRRRHAARMRSM